MHHTQTWLLLALTSLMVCGTLSKSLPESSFNRHSRARRALGTMTLIQKELELALGRHLPQGCKEIGCELLNPEYRHCLPIPVATLRVILDPGSGEEPNATPEFKPWNPSSNSRRSLSDTRMIELEALIALHKTGANRNIGHGQIDHEKIGKKRRSYDEDSVDGLRNEADQRLQLLRQVIKNLIGES